jgi:hypothetical protein
MGKQYACEKCGKTYDRMLIDWPDFCSVECASEELRAACGTRQTGASPKGNGRAE